MPSAPRHLGAQPSPRTVMLGANPPPARSRSFSCNGSRVPIRRPKETPSPEQHCPVNLSLRWSLPRRHSLSLEVAAGQSQTPHSQTGSHGNKQQAPIAQSCRRVFSNLLRSTPRRLRRRVAAQRMWFGVPANVGIASRAFKVSRSSDAFHPPYRHGRRQDVLRGGGGPHAPLSSALAFFTVSSPDN